MNFQNHLYFFLVVFCLKSPPKRKTHGWTWLEPIFSVQQRTGGKAPAKETSFPKKSLKIPASCRLCQSGEVESCAGRVNNKEASLTLIILEL